MATSTSRTPRENSPGSGENVSSGFPPMQTSAAHVPPLMQALAVSHAVPVPALESAGQSFALPLQDSAMSQSLTAARQIFPAAATASAGHAV